MFNLAVKGNGMDGGERESWCRIHNSIVVEITGI
jgi:hypothetical protein